MDSICRALDSIPKNVVSSIETTSTHQNWLRTTYVFWKQVQLPVIHPFHVYDAVEIKKRWGKLKEFFTTNLSFVRHNWKQLITYLVAAHLQDKASAFVCENCFFKAVNALTASRRSSSFLPKIRLIFPAILIPAITVAAQASFQASSSFLASRRGSPWTTLLAANFIFSLHAYAVTSLSISAGPFDRHSNGSLLNLGDGLKSMIFSKEEVNRIENNTPLQSRVKKVMALADFCFAGAMCSKSFRSKSPFWINAAWLPLQGVVQQIVTKCLLRRRP